MLKVVLQNQKCFLLKDISSLLLSNCFQMSKMLKKLYQFEEELHDTSSPLSKTAPDVSAH